LAVFVPYQLIWVPITGSVSAMEEEVAAKQKQLVWMQEATQQIQVLRRAGGGKRPTSAGSLLSLTESTARQAKVAVKKVQDEGDRGVRVWLEEAAFDDVLLWLDRLQHEHGVLIQELSVERQASPGKVNGRAVLEVQ
ncbi:MAG: type II secretion system protein M, partial [Pseudomonadota bacterium]